MPIILYLTKAAKRLLAEMAKPDAELTYSSGVWLTDSTRWHPDTVKQLLRLCVIRRTYDDQHGQYEIYEITSEGRKLLENPNYLPELVRILRNRHAA